jgi:aspartyl-tRNA(Asn)/glutamyl-tRNA(Gln) amidotransferase subunit B
LGIKAEALAGVTNLVNDGLINRSIAVQKLLPLILANPGLSPKQLAAAEGLLQKYDEVHLTDLVDEIIRENPVEADRYKKGKKGLVGWFMGVLMKRTKGQLDPVLAHRIIENRLK